MQCALTVKLPLAKLHTPSGACTLPGGTAAPPVGPLPEIHCLGVVSMSCLQKSRIMTFTNIPCYFKMTRAA